MKWDTEDEESKRRKPTDSERKEKKNLDTPLPLIATFIVAV